MAAEQLVEVWRGDILECTHAGHAVVCNAAGEIVESWGDPDTVILPRSSAKMLQALSWVETGAADRAGLTDAHLAVACASHEGEAIHTDLVRRWLGDLGMSEGDLRCGVQSPWNRDLRNEMIREDAPLCQIHNNCSGKHAGFLTAMGTFGGDAEYTEVDHPVQQAVKANFEEVTELASPGFGVDGCSAPNYATTVKGMAHAMAKFANASEDGDARERGMARLTRAMASHPALVAGTGRACTELMEAAGGRIALKFGAEANYVAILPEQGLGISLKITDGATRGCEAVIAALLVRLGVLEADHPAVQKRMNVPMFSRRGIPAGRVVPVAGLR
ncbi:asparaginase [Actibacterium pelagium]|uniref:Asparaginase n=1 Tax=Actibacterium pelagium TaxID=2029103 RepID=A0A917AJ39_9RHOB|nr:asparaginase [Actibacterium pelagium]GGE52816.1 hypothetical protein GCM10011517_20750 [Actibacterium pelagium]